MGTRLRPVHIQHPLPILSPLQIPSLLIDLPGWIPISLPNFSAEWPMNHACRSPLVLGPKAGYLNKIRDMIWPDLYFKFSGVLEPNVP